MKNALALFQIALLLLFACTENSDQVEKRDFLSSDTLIDAAGKTITLPANPKRVISPFTMYTRLIVALGGCEKLVGVSHTCVLPEEENGCNGSLLQLPDVGPFGRNIELVASLKPDLIFASHADRATFEEKTNACVVAVSFPHAIPMVDMFYRQINIIGKSLHMHTAADSLKQFITDKLDLVTSKTRNLSEDRKPKVYFAWTSWTGDILNTVCEFDPIELAGGINVAREAKNFAKGERGILVSREHIIQWNPEIVFISRYESQKWIKSQKNALLPVTIKDVLNDPLLQTVDAVKTQRIYYTTTFCNWWPHQRALVQVLYMAKLFHPDLFSGLNVEKESNEIFKRFYGKDSLYSAMSNALELQSWK